MASEKQKKTVLRTPAGKGKWVKVFTPDTKFDEAGTFSVKFIPSKDDALKMLKVFKEMQKAAAAQWKEKFPKKKLKLADTPWSTDEETGETTFNFKSVATGEKDGQKWTRKIPVFDAKGKPITTPVAIGNGSIVKVAYTAEGFVQGIGAGVSLRLEALQLLTLVEYEGRSADQFGFEEEDGFEFGQDAALPGEDLDEEDTEDEENETDAEDELDAEF